MSSPTATLRPQFQASKKWILLAFCALAAITLTADSGLRRIVGTHLFRFGYGLVEPTDDSARERFFGPHNSNTTESGRDRITLQSLLDSWFLPHRMTVRRFENPSLPLARPDFAHEDHESQECSQFRVAAGVLLAKPCDLFKLSQRVRSLTIHGESPTEPSETNPLEYLQRAKRGEPIFCRHFAVVYGALANALGYTSRLIGLSSTGTQAEHAACEVYAPEFGKWILIDPDFNVAYRRHGEWLNAYELQQAWQQYQATTANPATPNVTTDAAATSPAIIIREKTGVELVPLGDAGQQLRRTNLNPARSGMNLEYFNYVLYAVRDDYLSRRYPFGHPNRWRQFVLSAKATAPLPTFCPEAERPQSLATIYWPVGRTCLEVIEPMATLTPGLIVHLKTWTPNFADFQIQMDDATERRFQSSESFDWPLHPGINKLQVRSRNRAELLGEPATIEIEMPELTISPFSNYNGVITPSAN